MSARLILFVLAVGMCAFSVTAEGSPASSEYPSPPTSVSEGSATPIRLPIEVLGPEGYTVSASVNVSSPSEVSRLYLRLHRPVYRDVSVNPGRGPKASVRLNNGPWVGITNATADVFDHEAEFGGLNGTYHTLRMTIPISSLGTPQAGPNTISFRFNGTDGLTIGYRVLDLNLLRAGGSEILPADAFVYDDPALWEPMSNNPADIAAGRQLWYSATLVDRPGGPSIQATCGDCHSHDGRDLWYFAYSDRAIVARSEFHGLSRQESEKIASYIRSLQDSDETFDFAPPGRPWNPPFQPGPGLDLLPAHAWSAGAGLEWVLERDADLVPYVFPDGITKDAIPHDEVWSVREIPLAFQFPDWNEWLLEVHPIDIWGNTFTNDPSYQAYTNARNAFENNTLQALVSGPPATQPQNLMHRLAKEPGNFYNDRGGLSGANTGAEVERRVRALEHWATVKTWEIMQEFEATEIADDIFGPTAEARSWVGRTRLIYDLAPHMIATNNVSFAFQSGAVGKHFSTAWYNLQLIVNTGNTVESGQIAPFDWNYHHNHVISSHTAGGSAQPFRDLLGFAKQNQIFGIGDSNISDPYGVRWKQAHPWRYTPNGRSAFYRHASVPQDTLALVYDAVLGAFMDRIGPHTSGWNLKVDTDGDGSYCDEDRHALQPPSFNGEPDGADCNNNATGWLDPSETNPNLVTGRGRHAETWYQMIPQFRDMGVSETTLTRLIDWGEAMWPLGPWDDLRVDPVPMPPTAADDAASVSVGGTITVNVLANDADPDGSLNASSVAIVAAPAHGTTTVNPATGAVTYAHDGSATSADAFAYTVADNEGNVSNEATVTITINHDDTEPTTHNLDLQTGWNMVALTVTPDVSTFADMFGDVGQLVMVKGASGQIFFPEYELDQLHTWDPTQAYQVLVDGDAMLAVQGTPLVAAETPIALHAGWNLLPFFLNAPQPVEDALASILDDLNYLSDDQGGVFDPHAGVNTIGMLEPGRGYRAHLSEDRVLIYPTDGGRQSEVAVRSLGALERTLRPRR